MWCQYLVVGCGSGESEAQAAAVAGGAVALDPDGTSHGFNQFAADVESEASATDWSRNIALEAYELLKEQRDFVWWNARAFVLYADTDIFSVCFWSNCLRSIDENSGLRRC